MLIISDFTRGLLTHFANVVSYVDPKLKGVSFVLFVCVCVRVCRWSGSVR